MVRSISLWLACAGLCSFACPTLAQLVPDDPVVITYSTLGMSQPVDGSIVDVASDGTNRVWAVAPGRVSATLFNNGAWQRAPLFPITDTPLPATARFSSVAFAVPSGNAADGEHFYLGSNLGITWGRVTSVIDFKSDLLLVEGTFPPGANPNNTRELGSDGSDWLWAASDGGLVLWDLTESSPALNDIFLDAAGDGPIQHVAVAPWPAAAAAVDGDRLYIVDVLGTESLVRDLGTSPIPGSISGVFSGIAFDAFGNLWAATTSTTSSVPWLMKFEFDDAGLLLDTKWFPLNPPAPSVGMLPTDIAVDRLTGRVWVTTAGNQGPDRDAYYQDPDAAGDLGGTWGVVTSTFDRHTVVHTDAAGNAWFGMAGSSASSEALNGYIVRLISLDKSRYLGADNGVVSLLDYTLAGSGTQDTVDVSIEVGSVSAVFPVLEEDDSGQFTQLFSIVPSAEAGVDGTVFRVSSSATDVPVVASYSFPQPDPEQTLTASASWANIVPFEDDLLIGGPCFLDSLGW